MTLCHVSLLIQNINSVTSDTVYLPYFQLRPRTVCCCVPNRIMLCKIYIFYCTNMLVLSCFSPGTLNIILTFTEICCFGVPSSCSAPSLLHISRYQHDSYTVPSSTGYVFLDVLTGCTDVKTLHFRYTVHPRLQICFPPTKDVTKIISNFVINCGLENN